LHKSIGKIRISAISDALKFTEEGTNKMAAFLTKRRLASRQRFEQDGRVILMNILKEWIEKLAL
jgi:hypothetical protein